VDALDLILISGGVIAGTGVLALTLGRTARLAATLAVMGAAAGSVVGLWGALWVLHADVSAELSATWTVPGGGLVIGIDPLSALFLAPLFVIGGVCAVYGRGYLGPRPAQAAELNLFIVSMMLVLIARHGLLFLVAWEAMTLLAYVLITLEHGDSEVRRAGWVYLIASHVGVLALFGLFLALSTGAGGSFDFASWVEGWRTSTSGTAGILALALIGFGTKAGVVGLHGWLPEAHAASPSHISALMSAVLIKLGLYGILRTTILVSPGPWFGAIVMGLGIAGALLGVTLALTQRDLKRILAYSSIENIGIILIGLGLGFWAQARGDERLAALALAGGFLHIWNHAAMKGLMFLGAGSVLHGTGTKDIDRMGGLLGKMRWTGTAMVLGAVAIAGLPPLCGFTGEWLIYRGLTELGISGSTPSNLVAMGGAAALALVGGLGALCFVRMIGVALLGTPRGEGATHAHESSAMMLVPMWILVSICVVGALVAPALVSIQASAVNQVAASSKYDVVATAHFLAPVTTVNLALLLAIALGAALMIWRAGGTATVETWGCGYAAPTSRMQYTGRGFSELLAMRVLPRWVRAKLRIRAPEGAFPLGATFASDVTDPLTRGAYEPLLVRVGDYFARLRFLQQGNLHVYLFYVLAALVGGLAWVAIRDWLRW